MGVAVLYRRSVLFVFISLLILLVYANTFNASWHLDDRPNIVNNTYLHLEALTPQNLVRTLYTDHNNPNELATRMYRPVACLSFALNWYVGKDEVFGYHIVNIAIHILTALFLFLFISRLFGTPNLKNIRHADPVWIAFLASTLWAIHPIQTQAVTYIVQRMALLAAFFYICGLWAYLVARMSERWDSRLIWFAVTLVSLLLGINSKPNAAMLPMSIVLVEIVFFQNLTDKRTVKRLAIAVAVVATVTSIVGASIFLKGEPLSFLNLYHTRMFTPLERLLTEPRVILFYLSQIFFPLPSRFSIAHDVVLSTSLLSPWTTLPSICIVFSLIGFSLSQLKKRPLLSFSILFFFLNHIIESSIIGLEIIFEHRNYLPSFFLFLPIACWLTEQLNHYRSINRKMHGFVLLLIVALISFLSASTYQRNSIWKDDLTLWRDALKKAPNNARALNIIAIRLAFGEDSNHPDRYDMALKLFKESLEKHLPSTYVEADIHYNMALIYFHHKHDPDLAYRHFNQALQIHPENLKIRRTFAETMVLNRDFEGALGHTDRLLAKKTDSGRYMALKGHILLWMGKYDKAFQILTRSYPLLSDQSSAILDLSVCLCRMKRFSKAEELLLDAIKNHSDNIVFYLAAIENSMRAEEEKKASQYANAIIDQYGRARLEQAIDDYGDNPRYAPLSKELLLSAIERSAQ